MWASFSNDWRRLVVAVGDQISAFLFAVLYFLCWLLSIDSLVMIWHFTKNWLKKHYKSMKRPIKKRGPVTRKKTTNTRIHYVEVSQKQSPSPLLIRILLSVGIQLLSHCSRAARFMLQTSQCPSGESANRSLIQISAWKERLTSSFSAAAFSSRHPLVFQYFKTTLSEPDHRQACCTWFISSPKRSKRPSTQAPFCRHFCTVSSCPSSPACTRRDAIWREEPGREHYEITPLTEHNTTERLHVSDLMPHLVLTQEERVVLVVLQGVVQR